jgi:hypothetical protein
MYDNSTPIGGKVSNGRGNLVSSSKSNPCPVCGRTKDRDCRISSDGKMVLCHQNFDNAKTQQTNLWHYDGTSSDGRCGVYVFKEPTTKSVRPKDTRYWYYPDRNGSPLIRVVRVDDGKGKKKVWQEHWDKNTESWVKGWGDVARASIPIYRYREVREAITQRKPIYTVEGEPCADILWKLGLAATTNIGGGTQFTLTDSGDLQGAELIVIVPDRDEKGIEHAEKVAEYFSQPPLWLYPFPESKVWENLPKDHGLDIADWIEHNKLTAEDIVKVIGEKRVFKTPAPAPQAVSNVVPLRVPQSPDVSKLGEEVEELLDSGIKKSQLQLKISELAQKFRLNSADVWKYYRERESELSQETEQEDTAAEVAQLLTSKSATLNLMVIFPPELAEGITRWGQTLNIKPECVALALLTQVSSLLKPGTSTMLYPQTNFSVCPNYYGGVISEPSQKKTPVIRVVITNPMKELNAAAQEAYAKEYEAWEVEIEKWKNSKEEDKGPKPKEPARRVYYITTGTGESIPKQAARVPDQSLLWVADELAGMFKSPNQYRGGKGSDEENLLEYWSGGGAAVLRANGLVVEVEHIGLSIFGNIQPKVLAEFLGDGSDNNGKFARFDFIQQPLAATQLLEDAPNVDITPMLTALYKHLDPLPAQNFQLDASARKLFIAYYNQCELDRVSSPKQGMRAMLGKAAEKVGKIATILHAIHEAFKGGEISKSIPVEIVRGAIQFVKYTTDQALSVNLDICEPSALAPNLAKIISLAERNGGTISAAKVAKSYNAKLRPSSEKIREWLDQLASLKYGEVTSNGRNISFTLSPQSPTSPLTSKPYIASAESVPITSVSESPTSPFKTSNEDKWGRNGDEWGRNGDAQVPISKPLSSKNLSANGDYGDAKNHFSEKSNSLTLGCTTKPAEFAEQIRKAIANFDRALAIQVWDGLKAKIKRKLREEVKSHLTSTENENFKLLVATGFLQGMRVKYVGDSKYAEQYEGLELEVYSIDEYFQITCRKPNGAGYTTRLKPEELEIIS